AGTGARAHRLLAPGDEVRGGHMPPADVLVAGRGGVVLEEDLPAPVGGADDPVRVVDPAARRDAVQNGEVGVTDRGDRGAAPGGRGARGRGGVGGVTSRSPR